ncbi:hypothetical protein GGF31_005455 [Allomyces arbusculus]|nr:hypothetical protein GGF31_005455 [Allomyces arbusculus]
MSCRPATLTRTLLLAVLALLLATTLLARALPTPQDAQIEALPACTLNDDPEAGTCTTTTDGEFTTPVVDNTAAQDGDSTANGEEDPVDGVANLFRRHLDEDSEVLEVAAGDADEADELFRRDAVVEDSGEDAAEEVVPADEDGDNENDAADVDDSDEPVPVEAGDEPNIVLMDTADADGDDE